MREFLEQSLICEDEDMQEITFPRVRGMKLSELADDENKVDLY